MVDSGLEDAAERSRPLPHRKTDGTLRGMMREPNEDAEVREGEVEVDGGPDDRDADLFDEGDGLAACPACGAELYIDAEKCEECGEWLSAEHRRSAGGPTWKAWVIALALLGLILYLMFRG